VVVVVVVVVRVVLGTVDVVVGDCGVVGTSTEKTKVKRC
jgi:hypothetical protein